MSSLMEHGKKGKVQHFFTKAGALALTCAVVLPLQELTTSASPPPQPAIVGARI